MRLRVVMHLHVPVQAVLWLWLPVHALLWCSGELGEYF
jgi:hypothetical protein